MQTRKPIVAGQFYPVQHDLCLDEITGFIENETLSDSLPETIVAGIVPHAGWTFSGQLAELVFSAIRQQHEKIHTFVIFGAAHSYMGPAPAVYDKGAWVTPLGEIAINEDLAEIVIKNSTAKSDLNAHADEHSIEVQIPFIQHFFAGAKILPIIVPPADQAIKLGEAVGDIIKSEKDKKIICIGSTDLTHYGPRYGFAPAGVGQKAIQWATEVNDRQFIDLALKVEPEKLLENAVENYNACGPGAAAATVTIARKLGKTKGVLLAHTNSNEIMKTKMRTTSNESVGYAAIVF
jgi:MEMO1 family protein